MAGDLPTSTNKETDVAQAQPRGGGSFADEILRAPGSGDSRPAAPAPAADTAAKPTDARPAAPAAVTDTGRDVVLKLSYNDPKFDESIWKTVKYNAIEISDFPKDARVQHWADKDGYFFYLTDASGKMIDNKLHHYPGNVAKLIINGNTQDLVKERQKVSEAIARKNDINIKDGVLTVDVKDAKFDEKVHRVRTMDTINLTGLAPGAKIAHGMDGNGFFFEVGDGKKHYYPTNAKQLAVDGKVTMDLTKTRYQDIESYSNASFGGFKDYSRGRDPMTNAQQVINFAAGMDKQAGRSLDVLDKGLTEAIASSEHHPYFKYLLANVKLAQAMGAVRERVLTGQSINHPSVIDKLDKADELLDQVIKESDGRLRVIGRGFPRPNAPLMPLAPYAPYDPRDPNGLYSFWGGTYDQAGFMKPGVKFIKGLVQSNVLALPAERP